MAHVEKRGPGRWRARYRAPNGNERSRTFSRRVDAERWLAEMEVAKGRGEWIDPRLGRTTFGEWTEEWQRTIVDLRDSTLSRDLGMVRNHLLPHFGRTPLAAITTTDVRSLVAQLQASGQHSPATVRKIGQVLAKIMASAVEGGLIGRSPCTGVRLPVETRRDMRFLTPEQVGELADAIGPAYGTLVYTATYAGLRWGELAGLKPERVDLLRRTISVTEQLLEVDGRMSWGPPKTAAGRRAVSIPATLAGMLEKQLLTDLVKASGLVFPSPDGHPQRRSNFRRRAWMPATRAIGLEGLRFHDLRHTAVALAIAQGGHSKAIQERMGHSSIQVTLDRYGHLFPALDERVADGLDVMLRESLAVSARPDDGRGVVELAAKR